MTEAVAFGGYYQNRVPKEDPEITHVGPGTPLGEYFRRFWLPVCMSSQLDGLPHKVRILGEDLVAFRDRQGRIGLLARHCCHRGASLEFGVIQERGIRCCYHGIHFDCDGTIIEVPPEKDRGENMRKRVAQGAYPAFERDGLVFAYLGPPEEKPAFPECDAFEKYADTRLVPFSNVFPCNWLQVQENIADQMHTAILHNPACLYDGEIPPDLNLAPFTLPSFAKIPALDYLRLRNGTAMAFIAGRRTSDDLVWWRINECGLPCITHHAYLFEDGKERRLFHRVNMTRWHVPVDDTNTIIFGWRMFGSIVDPLNRGDETKVGWDSIDFLEGQVGNRSYEEQRRLAGDWEAIVSQRPIAVHALENATSGDAGVYMFRRTVREAVTGKNPAASPAAMHERPAAGLPWHTYTQNTILKIPKRPTEEEDNKIIREIGRRLVAITADADDLTGQERTDHVTAQIEALEKEYS